MPFDRLPGRIDRIPELYQYHPLPPRPIIPWASIIVPEVDKIAQAAMYASPYQQQLRQADLAKAQVGMLQARQAMQLAPQQLAVEQAKLGYEQKYLSSFGSGGGFGNLTSSGMIPGPNGLPVFDPNKANQFQDLQNRQRYGNQVNEFDQAAADYVKKKQQAASNAPVTQSTDQPSDDSKPTDNSLY